MAQPTTNLDRSGSVWFARPTDPRAPLSQYVTSKIHVGMAQPPQNEYVRREMLDYFSSLGIAPPAEPKLPPPRRRLSPEPQPQQPQWHPTTASNGSSSSSCSSGAGGRRHGGADTMLRDSQSEPILAGAASGRSSRKQRSDAKRGRASQKCHAQTLPALANGLQSIVEAKQWREAKETPKAGQASAEELSEEELMQRRPRKPMSDGEMELLQAKLRNQTRHHRMFLDNKDGADLFQLTTRHSRTLRGRHSTALPPMPRVGGGDALEPVEGAALRLRQLRKALGQGNSTESTESSPKAREALAIAPLAEDLRSAFALRRSSSLAQIDPGEGIG